MVESSETKCPFSVGEHIDCLDTVKKWCNAEVVEVDMPSKTIYVHYTGFTAKYDEWISWEETARIHK